MDAPEETTHHGNRIKCLPPDPKNEVEEKVRGFLVDAYWRLGWIVETVLIGGTLGILGIVGFWIFLWFANDSNPT